MPRFPNYYFERQCWAAGRSWVAGVDEAGRGAWAGPIVAAAVILPADAVERRAISNALTARAVQVNDSKLLSPDERETLVDALSETTARIAVAIAGVDEIDRRGIGFVNSALLREAVELLRPRPDFVLSDAFLLPDFGRNQLAVVHGDRRSKSIALASCVAKVTRDRMMCALAQQHPGYDFERHKGYGTARHRQALLDLGPSPVHRRSFAPVRRLNGDASG